MFSKVVFATFFIFLSPTFAQVEVEVPSSRIVTKSTVLDTTTSAIEFLASSVNYMILDSVKWSANTPNFSADYPLVGINYVSAYSRYDYVFGFGLSTFRRWGETEVRGPILKNEQIAYLVRFRTGYRHHILRNNNSQIYASASILPTIFFATESPLGRGETATSLPTQIGIGGSFSYFTLEGFLENFYEPGFSAGFKVEL
ncbi:MAG: hypothetical protein A4S09_06795 [Proteobacteria bacterium SG_bin7]|nr:MAG: hypothetical protein A4S09_06795 [Proteobacteria bacterium SG_bin7]